MITQEDIAILTDEGADIESIIVSQDGSLLAAVSPNKGKISLWELGSFEKIAEHPFEGYLTSMYHPVLYLEGKFSEDNGLLAIAACSLAVPPTFVFGNSECGSSDVIIYDTNTHKMETQISAVLTSTIHVSFNNEGTKLAIVGWGTDYLEIKIWGIEEKEFLVTLLGDENQYWDAQFDASGEQMFSSGSKYGYALLMWDTTTWEIKKIVTSPVTVVTIVQTSNNSIIISHNASETFIIWDLVSGQVLREVRVPSQHIFNLEVDPSMRYIYTVDDLEGLRISGIP